MKKTALFIISGYQLLMSPLLHTVYGSTNVCRFYPTCSKYLKAAVSRYGIIKGLWLGLKRISLCRPGSKGGFDPVK